MPKSIAEQIADLQATRKTQTDAMKKLQNTAAEQSRTLDSGEQEEFDTAKEAVKTIDQNIANLRELEAIEKAEEDDKKTAKPVNGEAKVTQKQAARPGVTTGVQVKNTEKLEPGIGFAQHGGVVVGVAGGHREEVQRFEGGHRVLFLALQAHVVRQNLTVAVDLQLIAKQRGKSQLAHQR